MIDIAGARERLVGVAETTPLMHVRWLSDLVGGPVFLKCENLQRTGSFKIRGAYNRIAGLSDEERARGVVAASAGNHAQGVALAASRLGVPSTVFMPTGATLPKIEATAGYGAQVRLSGETLTEALAAAQDFAERTGAVFIHPFDHPDIIAGQATVGLEIAEQLPDVRSVVVCTGGGGLLAGVCLGLAQVPDVRIVGVQAAGAASYVPSLEAGHPVALPDLQTLADGIAVGRPGDLPFGIISDAGVEIMTVDDEQIARASVMCLERSKMVVEPAGAAALAAVVGDPGAFEPPVVVTLSGGNVDPLLLLRIIQRGLVAAGRYLVISAMVPDRPGHLELLLASVAQNRANVVTVTHNRTDPRLRVDECQIIIEIEVRGPEHAVKVLDAMRATGYEISLS